MRGNARVSPPISAVGMSAKGSGAGGGGGAAAAAGASANGVSAGSSHGEASAGGGGGALAFCWSSNDAAGNACVALGGGGGACGGTIESNGISVVSSIGEAAEKMSPPCVTGSG